VTPTIALGARVKGLLDELEDAGLSHRERYERFSIFVQELAREKSIAEREGGIAVLAAALAFGDPEVTRRAMAEATAAGLSPADVGQVNQIVARAKALRSPAGDADSGPTVARRCC